MNFRDFIRDLKSEIEFRLPGEEAHQLMFPLGRYSRDLAMKRYPKEIKESAVLLCLYPNKEKVEFTLMLRNSYKGVHSRQISLPGGKVESIDKNFSDTALREYEEEMGVNRKGIEMLGDLTALFIPPSGFFVQPLVGCLTEKPAFEPDSTEVQEIIHADVEDLLKLEIRNEKVLSSSNNVPTTAPAFKINDHVVWGATAMILSEFRELCKRFN